MTGPQPTASAILASWVDNAAPWTDAVRGDHIPSRRDGTNAAIVDTVRSLGAARVLDVGCGEGWLCRALHAAGMEVTGIDGSPDLIRSAREAGGGTFHLCSYDELVARSPIGGSFQAVVCNFSLFERDLAPLLTTLGSMLVPGGSLVIQTVHPGCTHNGGTTDGWRREDFGAPGKSPFKPMPWYFRTAQTWTDELLQAGFASVEQTRTTHPQSNAPLSLIISARTADVTPALSPG